MLDQNNPQSKKNSAAAATLAAGMKDMKQSKLFQKFLQKQQPARPGQANNLKTSTGATTSDQRSNLEASMSQDTLKSGDRANSSAASAGLAKGIVAYNKNNTMLQGSFMGHSQQPSGATTGKALPTAGGSNSISMLPTDLRNAKQLESFERFKKSQAEKQTAQNQRQPKPNALAIAKSQQKTKKAQRDKKAGGLTKKKKEDADLENQIEEEFEIKQKKLEDEQSAFVDHKKNMMRSPRNDAPPKSNRNRMTGASMASEAFKGDGMQGEQREARPSQHYVQLSKDHYA